LDTRHDLMLRAYHRAAACRTPLFRLAARVDLASTPARGLLGGEYTFFPIFSLSGFSHAATPRRRETTSRPHVQPADAGGDGGTQPRCNAARCRAQGARLLLAVALWETFVSRRAHFACFPNNTTHAMCLHARDWQGLHACLASMGTPALRQVRHACATNRHFMWGAGRSRAELELLANCLAEALRIPRRSHA
jgi:hypothetical protein